MKNKLRKIVVNGEEFFYLIIQNHQEYAVTGNSFAVLKIFLAGQKETPLLVQFYAIMDARWGNIFYTGIALKNQLTDKTEKFNVNFPAYVQKFILYGQRVGWTGSNKVENLDGVVILREWGYDLSLWEIFLPK
ncbi:MAG: hypothetical protein ACRYFX_07215 [Janthinobacterium lividum]